jgi:4'-phosphopantetheinyl transferase
LAKLNSIDQKWHAACDSNSLSYDEVHVWRLIIDSTASVSDVSSSILSVDERARTDSFLLQTDKLHFAATRVMLRRILSLYLGVLPEKITFHYGSHGKPCLSSDDHPEDLRFNVSHTQGLSLIAVSRKRDIGIDVERNREETPYEVIARGFLSKNELKIFHKLTPVNRMSAFFTAWTQKEALVKALGKGLSISLDRIELLFDSPAFQTTINLDGQRIDSKTWWLTTLHPAANYSACLAIQGPPCLVRLYDYSMECFQSGNST